MARRQLAVSFTAVPSACEYLPDQLWQLRYEIRPDIRPEEYMERLRCGWRRFGPVLFRPACPSCRMCRSLRVPVALFKPTAGQRRVWRSNHQEVTFRIGRPSMTGEKQALLDRFHRDGERRKGWPKEHGADLALLVENPFPTEEWRYYAGDRLIGLGYVDALPEGLSAIYFAYDPEQRRRSLGTFNILALIASAAARGLPHVYLGYYVEGYRSLAYKVRFRPNEILHPDGRWVSFVTAP
ncbi:MAG TPA: arginyltransferase, partial [Vicinamibacterales bacterium]|nr:arginyltransferase [Vicinamibacterales bacterium]